MPQTITSVGKAKNFNWTRKRQQALKNLKSTDELTIFSQTSRRQRTVDLPGGVRGYDKCHARMGKVHNI